jgi:hypothetical protein
MAVLIGIGWCDAVGCIEKQPTIDEVARYIDEILEDDLRTVVEDNSTYQVAATLIQVFQATMAGDSKLAQSHIDAAPPNVQHQHHQRSLISSTPRYCSMCCGSNMQWCVLF